MKLRLKITDLVACVLVAVSLVLLSASVWRARASADSGSIARKVSRVLEKRIAEMDGYIDKALKVGYGEWMDLGKVPDDIVVYRYSADTLQSWCNTFPINNDELGSHIVFRGLADPRFTMESPLVQVGDSVDFVLIGPSWYLAKSRTEGDVQVIAGLEITGYRGIGIDEHYSIRSLSETGGTAVTVGGKPLFKIICESLSPSGVGDSRIVWLSVMMILAAAVLFLYGKRSTGRFCISVGVVSVVMLALYFWGRTGNWRMMIFSPMLYAGGEVLYSLGAVVIINLEIFMLALCLFMARDAFFREPPKGIRRWLFPVLVLVAVAAVVLYARGSLRSIIVNSGISLEIYKLSELSPFTLVVYLSFVTMLLSVPLLLQLLKPLSGNKFDSFSLPWRVAFSAVIALFIMLTAAGLGFRKEQERAEVWANRLAVDRDIFLEMNLRRVENEIADDIIISSLSVFQNTAGIIQNRIRENHLARLDQNYEVNVYVFNEENSRTREAVSTYNSLLGNGTPIADNSRFLFVNKSTGYPYYVGMFLYMVEGQGISRVLVRVEQKNAYGRGGYAGILGMAPPGQVMIPAAYSFARYSGNDLKYYYGTYPYPTRMDSGLLSRIRNYETDHISEGGYIHFANVVSEDEVILLSRAKYSLFTYLVAAVFISLIAFAIMSLFAIRRCRKDYFEQGYFRSRISAVLLASLILTMVAMALFSVLFVNSRNESNLRTVMSEKINNISTMLNTSIRNGVRTDDIFNQSTRAALGEVSGNTGSDITLYSTAGKVMMSSNQSIFDRMLLGSRINPEAYRSIIYDHDRYCILKEHFGPRKYYSMYAPLFGEDGRIVAILSSPYTEESYDFEEDAVNHSVSIVSIFLLLLLLARFFVSRIVDRMFKPLGEMSSKMNSADIQTLEYIDYNRNDEVSSIVRAYNGMVKELSESSRKLAQAERDKAWSGMARQVAHEIKNPLTPMKLQLQRVIRLKQKGDPAWQDRFDEASKVLLDHIDILTDTANEFSTFAKLYTEEPTRIVLDSLLMEEITMFDNKDNIEFSYLGLKDAAVMGPKPQLTRVFVNLIGNSVQAIADMPDGRITVSLRNSMKDGYYDIVFEDNGPGVSEENVDKLFTPNFTTKTGGSGLGLAISRSILEKCGATISYSRSFTLGGACFTIRYPK